MSLQYQTDEPQPDNAAEEIPAQVSLPFPVYTVVLIAAYAVVAAVQFGVGLDRSIMLAGFDKPAFLHQHEYWRILTGATLHGSLLHLVMNSYAFFSFGRIFEMLTNRAHLAIVFLLSAIGGGLLSLVMLPDGVSIGASGGIVGLIGYLLIYAFRRREFISYEFRKSLLINIGFILVFGLLLYQTIDNYGHIGGLITGAVYGLLQVPGDSFADPREAGRAAETFGLISIGIYVAACAFSILLMLGVV
jgi:membrane associated rhomboid family serine protease